MTAFAMGLDAAIALFKRYRWLIIAAPLCLALAVQTWRLSGVKRSLTDARATIVQMETASKAARQAQIALNQATEAAYKAEAERTDHAHTLALNDALRRSAAYADRNRLHAHCSGSSGPGAAAAGSASEGGHGTSSDALVVTRSDFDTLNANTVRLKAINEWGQRLIEQGLAVPSQAAKPD